MNKDEFKLLKDRLYRAENSLELALTSCPKLKTLSIASGDGRTITAQDVFSYLEKLRLEVWKYGSAESQERHIATVMRQQARG